MHYFVIAYCRNFPMGHNFAFQTTKSTTRPSHPENLLGQVLVVAGGSEGTGNAKYDDLLALQGADVQVLGDSAGVLQRGIVGAIFG